LPTDEPIDDLAKPLGQSAKKKKKRFVLPIPVVTRVLAGLLALCVAVLAGWILFVDEPFGGEPVAVVSAVTGGSGEAKVAAESQPLAKPSAAPIATEAEKKTVTIIDGTTGKRQDVTVGQSSAPASAEPAQKKSELKGDASPDAPIDQRLTDTSQHGAIPKIAPDGARASDIYARPIRPQASRADQPRIAIVIEGLGTGANGTAQALAKLPAAITFAFTPYGTDIERWVARARAENHEVLLQVGMEPFDYPDNDPGPQTLLASLTPEQNIDRLHWFLSRFQGYVGVTSLMGARFTATDQALSPVIREIGKRGLIWFDDGNSPRSAAAQISGAANVAFAKADAVLDAVPTAADIDSALARLEATARSRGVAVGAASALPVTIERIAQWVKTADARGVLLVPISMVANRAKTGS
jgi:polysaccharide deacetylase 2 family uncharacterized protein YibQ